MTGWLEQGPTSEPSGARGRDWLKAGRWLLPWLAMVLVSAGCASAMNLALTGAWVPLSARSEPAHALAGPDVPPADQVGQGDDAQAVDLACVSRVASYESLLEAVRRCSIPAVATQPPVFAADAEDDSATPDRSCVSLFGSFNGWLFDGRGRGPCGLGVAP
jgi:hypothetical protein